MRTLVGQLNLAGRTVSLDALHVQADTVRLVVQQGQASLLLATAVKKNQPTLLEDLRAIDWDAPSSAWPPNAKPSTKPTWRIETRRCRMPRPDRPGLGTAMPTCPIAAKPSASSASAPTSRPAPPAAEVTYSLTSLSPAEADSQRLMTSWSVVTRRNRDIDSITSATSPGTKTAAALMSATCPVTSPPWTNAAISHRPLSRLVPLPAPGASLLCPSTTGRPARCPPPPEGLSSITPPAWQRPLPSPQVRPLLPAPCPSPR